MQPKIHKEGNSGKLVISSLSCNPSKISEYVDFHLQPIVKQIPSCVNDTTDFLRTLDVMKFVPDNIYLVSIDVNSF